MKYQRNSEVGMTFNHVCEFLGSYVCELLSIPVQETYLDIYKGKQVVLLKHFCKDKEILVPFNSVGESSLEEDKESYQHTYEDIQMMLNENLKSIDVKETIDRFGICLL